MAEYPKVGFAAFVDGLESGMNTMADYLLKRDKLRQNQLDWDAQDAYGKRGKDGGGYGGGSEINAPAIGPEGSSTGKGGAAGSGGGEGAISDQDLYSFFVNNLNATKEEATLLTSGAANESNFRYDVTHDGGIGYGLWGHNGDRLAAMRKSAGVGGSDTVPWEKQAAFALEELRSRPEGQRLHDGMSAKELTDAQMDFEQPKRSPATNDGNYAARLATTTKLLTQPPLMQAMTAAGSPADTSGIPGATPGVKEVRYEEAPVPTQAIGASAAPAAPAGPPDEVQTSAYTAPRSAVMQASYTPSGGGLVPVGDSIARGFNRFGKLEVPDDQAAVDGRNPVDTLAYLKSRPPGYFQGKDIILSGGASNNPSQISSYSEQIAQLKKLGANQIHVVGVGTKAGVEGNQYHDLNPYNAQIEQIAREGGANPLGGIPRAVVHPGTDYYGHTLVGIRGPRPQAAIGAPQDQYAALVPTTTGSELYPGYG